jgi:hypothetical protein
MCVLICVILLVCVKAIAFFNFPPKCGATIQPKTGHADKIMAWQMYGPVQVKFGTRQLSLCIVTLIIAHVSLNALLENVMFE